MASSGQVFGPEKARTYSKSASVLRSWHAGRLESGFGFCKSERLQSNEPHKAVLMTRFPKLLHFAENRMAFPGPTPAESEQRPDEMQRAAHSY